MDITKAFGTTNTTYLKNRDITYISIHYDAGVTSKAGTAASLAAWFKAGANPNNPSSSDFIVDDYNVVQYNPDIENRYTWCVGGKKYNKMSTSLGGRLYGIAKNSNCINIEIKSNKRNTKSLSADDRDWYFTDAALDLTAELVRELMAKYNIPSENVIMHHEVTGKLCPAMWTHDESELQGWYNFKKKLSPAPVKAEDDVIYCVQTGAFRNKAYAEKELAEVRKFRPGAFIKEMKV